MAEIDECPACRGFGTTCVVCGMQSGYGECQQGPCQQGPCPLCNEVDEPLVTCREP